MGDDQEKDPNKVAGGIARASVLSPERRREIGRQAALTRYGKALPKAIAEGVLKIGDLPLQCAVLDDAENTRVFTQQGFLQALGARARRQRVERGRLSTATLHFFVRGTLRRLFQTSCWPR